MVVPIVQIIIYDWEGMSYIGSITNFLHSIVATWESNENGLCLAQLDFIGLLSRPEIDNVVFLGNTKVLKKIQCFYFY